MKRDPANWRTLLLNSCYGPLATLSWQRAVSLVWVDKVDVVAEYSAVVRSPSIELPVPAVIRLRRYLRLPYRGVPFSRRNLLIRDFHRCQYCQLSIGPAELTLDHVLPRSRGGKRTWENLVAACARCNRRKGNRTPKEAGMRLAKRPRIPTPLFPGVGLEAPQEPPLEWRPFLPRRRAS
jgi:5-methylcytosine-specific restriction endonuclease McrA